eukprot:3270213-Amphidinium_carterae.2
MIGLSEHCLATWDVANTTSELRDHHVGSHCRVGRVDSAGRDTEGFANRLGLLLSTGLEFIPTARTLPWRNWRSLAEFSSGWVLKDGCPCCHVL